LAQAMGSSHFHSKGLKRSFPYDFRPHNWHDLTIFSTAARWKNLEWNGQALFSVHRVFIHLREITKHYSHHQRIRAKCLLQSQITYLLRSEPARNIFLKAWAVLKLVYYYI
jgi:hypothetical protein